MRRKKEGKKEREREREREIQTDLVLLDTARLRAAPPLQGVGGGFRQEGRTDGRELSLSP